jgi:crossover junction endodeoxyribonuclease RuvC
VNILGLDPGTLCGWAILRDGHLVGSGVWDLRPRRHEGGGMRYLRVRRYVEELLQTEPLDAVGYEEVRRHLGVDAAHVYGGIVAAVTSVLEDHGKPYRGVPVATVKRVATGKGNASKDDMLEAFHREVGRYPDGGDDEADAYFVAVAVGREL